MEFNNQFRALLDSMPTLAAVIDAKCRLTAVNRVLATSLPAETSPGQALEMLLPAESVEEIKRWMQSPAPEYSSETEFTTGSEESYLITLTRMPIEGQQFFLLTAERSSKALMATESEETEHVRDQVFQYKVDELHSLRNELETLLRLTPVLVSIASFDGQLHYCNPQWQETLGWSAETLRTVNWKDLMAKEDLPAIADVLEKLRSEPAVQNFDCRVKTSDGTHRWISWNVASIANKELLYAVGKDITERKRISEQLRESEMNNRFLLDNMPQRIFYKNTDSVYLLANRAFAGDFGLTPEAVRGKSDYDLFPRHLAKKYRQEDEKLLATGETISIDEEWLEVQGEPGFVHMLKYPVRDESSGEITGIMGLFWEITEQIKNKKRLEKLTIELQEQAADLQQTNQRLQQQNEDMDDFLHIASHDMREPLRGIATYARFLKEDFGDDLEEEGTNLIQNILRLTRSMDDLIENLLTSLSIGKEPLQQKRVDIEATIRSVIKDLKHFIVEKNARIEIEEALPTITCDPILVREIFQNLILNGLKYNDSNPPVIEVGIRESTSSRDPVFYVRDNGIGIPGKHQDRVFKIFRRLHSSEKYGSGKGIGLTIAKKIIDRHGGRIWVESNHEKGSTFLFTLAACETEI